jgi:hypothetical protein
MAQQGFNPFAPQDQDQKQKAPKLQGVQAPNVSMQEQPGLVQTLAPSVFNKAMDSEAAGAMGDYFKTGAKNAWASLTTPTATTAATTAATAIAPQGALAAEALGTGLASSAPTLAALAPQGAMAAEALGTGLAAASQAAPVIAGHSALAATAPAALASAAPTALALGPFGIPILIGAGLMAATSGK